MNANRLTVEEINKNAKNDIAKYIEDSEQFFTAQINKILNEVAQNKNIKFILLAGPSSSGKTTTSKIMSKNLVQNGFDALPISLDDFFVAREKTPKWKDGTYNFETADAIDWKLFGTTMQSLLANKPTKLPTYDFASGKTIFGEETKIADNTIVIVEGLHALNPIIEKYINKKNCLSAYISTNTDVYENGKLLLNHETIRFYRRLIRDLFTRATSIESTLKNWAKVNLGEELYIKPYIDRADVKIDSFHPYELGAYRDVLHKCQNFDDKTLEKAKEIIRHFETVNFETVPKDSVLQEFLPKK